MIRVYFQDVIKKNTVIIKIKVMSKKKYFLRNIFYKYN